MQEELNAMESNNIWTITPLPKGKHSIGCKWIYKLKFNSDGSIARHKARLVAKGIHNKRAWISLIYFPLSPNLLLSKFYFLLLLFINGICFKWMLTMLF